MSDDQRQTRNKSARYFDWFVLAGLLMNVIIVTLLVGLWLFK